MRSRHAAWRWLLSAGLALGACACAQSSAPACVGSACPGAPDETSEDAQTDVGVGLLGDAVPDLEEGIDADGASDLDPSEASDPAPPSDATADAPAALAPQNDWGPAARVVWLDVPSDAALARASGCVLFARNAGTTLSSLAELAGGIPQLLSSDASGYTPLVLYLQAEGWPQGAPLGALPPLELRFLRGTPWPGQARQVLPQAFEEGDPAQPPVIRFADTQVRAEGWFTSSGRFLLTMPIFGLEVTIPVQHAVVRGRIDVDGPGVAVRDGSIAGYVPRAGVLEVFQQVIDGCSSPERPDLCTIISDVLGQDASPEQALQLALPLIGGFDAGFTDGAPRLCGGADGPCDAIGLCALFEADGTTIEGVGVWPPAQEVP